MWNMNFLQLLPRNSSEFAPVLMNSVRVRSATWLIVSAEADEISPMMQDTLSRSIMRSALVDAVCGLTESSLSSSTLRPLMPPAALISATAMSAACTAYSPSGPRKPVRGVRWPIRITSDWPRDSAGNPSIAAPAVAPTSRLRRPVSVVSLMTCLLGPVMDGIDRGSVGLGAAADSLVWTCSSNVVVRVILYQIAWLVQRGSSPSACQTWSRLAIPRFAYGAG